MKSKKKFLLLGVGVMGALALGVGATSTFAWFTAAQSVTVVSDDTPNTGAVSVSETSASVLNLSAEIHFVVEDGRVYNGNPASDKALNSGAIKLTTWGKSDGSGIDTVTDANNNTLITAAKRNAQSGEVYSALAADDIGWVYFPISAWIEDTSVDSNPTEWRTAINAAQTLHTGKATFDYTNTVGTGNLLLNTEVYFYSVAEPDAEHPTKPTSYARTSEVAASEEGGIDFQVSAKNLINSYEGTSQSHNNRLVLGYLLVRFEGSKRDHTPQTGYQATIGATSTVI